MTRRLAIVPALVDELARADGDLANPLTVMALSYRICTVIAGLNVYSLWQTIGPVWVGAMAAVMLGFAGWFGLAGGVR